ncbi:hypothetical protein KUTeg_015715 [Tegillarca granosa]|uniref:Uncharacterized protein n=1 Tax=Tegillarca granosa TaxID=220873 RepID=A0ABQ9ENZ1_TEGGR|nr:hypothetical protein KUTeg_015715 [Tegillarca granosa]
MTDAECCANTEQNVKTRVLDGKLVFENVSVSRDKAKTPKAEQILSSDSGQLHEGFDDDGEIGADRQLINHMKQYSMQNFVALITPKASHWRLGPKRFTYMYDIV